MICSLLCLSVGPSVALAGELPPISAETLSGASVELPSKPPAERTVLMVGLQRAHNADFEAWWPTLVELSSEPSIDWLELPFVDVGAGLRLVIEQAMELELSDPVVRAHFAPVCASPEPLKQSLGVDSNEQMLLLLEGGELTWSQSGGPSPERVEALRQALTPPPEPPAPPSR